MHNTICVIGFSHSLWQWRWMCYKSLKSCEPDKSKQRGCYFSWFKNHQCVPLSHCVVCVCYFILFLFFKCTITSNYWAFPFIFTFAYSVRGFRQNYQLREAEAFPVKLSLHIVMLRTSTIRRENDKNRGMVGGQFDMLDFKRQYCSLYGQNNMSAVQAM